MFKLLNKLQNKPESTRRSIAFLMTVALFFIVVLAWLFSEGSFYKENNKIENQKNSSVDSPLETIKQMVSDFKEEFDKDSVP